MSQSKSEDLPPEGTPCDPIHAAEEIGRLRFALRAISKIPVADQNEVAQIMRKIAKEAINDD